MTYDISTVADSLDFLKTMTNFSEWETLHDKFIQQYLNNTLMTQ